MGVKAECAWGEGPDVLIAYDGPEDSQGFPLMNLSEAGMTPLDTRRGMIIPGVKTRYIEKASFGASAKSARRLAAQLIVAAERAEELERGYAEAMRAPRE